MFKKLRSVLLISTVIAVTATATHKADAQASTNVSDGNFFTDTASWFSSYSSNTWNGTHGYFQTGAAYQNQVNVAASLEAGYNVMNFSTNADGNTGLTLAAEAFNAGIGGTILSAEADVFLRLDYKDVQILAGPGLGDDLFNHRFFIPLSAEVQKKLTAHTHAFVRIQENILDRETVPLFVAGVGGSF